MGFLQRFWKEVPKIPFTALVFYIVVTILWTSGIIPRPNEIIVLLEGLYNKFGLFGLFIATFLEGIAYLGLYFPGSFIIALAVFFSDGKFITLLTISIVVAIALTLTAFINYFLGRHILFKKGRNTLKEREGLSKNLFLSMIHPNLLAFYFFNAGIEGKNLWKIIFIPIIIIPYGLILSYVLFIFASSAKQQLENPYLLGSLILMWIVVAFIIDHKKKIKKEIKKLIEK